MPVRVIPTTKLPSGEPMPVFGVGTWRMGEDVRIRKEEVAALKLGIEFGVTLIDTAEMYGEGGAEEIVAEAAAGRRDELFIVSVPPTWSTVFTPLTCAVFWRQRSPLT